MSDTNTNPAEPTEPEPGSTVAEPTPDVSVDDLSAEPPEPEPGGKQ
jgi:hypothetical protein